jgi:hypothetical protein
MIPYLQNNQRKKDWRLGSSGRALSKCEALISNSSTLKIATKPKTYQHKQVIDNFE